MNNINWTKIKKILIYSLIALVAIIFCILSFYAIIFLVLVFGICFLVFWIKNKLNRKNGKKKNKIVVIDYKE